MEEGVVIIPLANGWKFTCSLVARINATPVKPMPMAANPSTKWSNAVNIAVSG